MRVSAILGTLLITSLVAAAGAGGRPGWLDVPYVPQSRDGCGAAAVAMVMQYWIRTQPHPDPAAADDRRIYRQLAEPGRKGISGAKLEGYLEAHGYGAHVFRGDLSDLHENLRLGRPLIACIAPRGSRRLFHYVVVVGVTKDAILFHDPARGKLMESRLSRFLHQWEPTGYWLMLATPRAERR